MQRCFERCITHLEVFFNNIQRYRGIGNLIGKFDRVTEMTATNR